MDKIKIQEWIKEVIRNYTVGNYAKIQEWIKEDSEQYGYSYVINTANTIKLIESDIEWIVEDVEDIIANTEESAVESAIDEYIQNLDTDYVVNEYVGSNFYEIVDIENDENKIKEKILEDIESDYEYEVKKILEETGEDKNYKIADNSIEILRQQIGYWEELKKCKNIKIDFTFRYGCKETESGFNKYGYGIVSLHEYMNNNEAIEQLIADGYIVKK